MSDCWRMYIPSVSEKHAVRKAKFETRRMFGTKGTDLTESHRVERGWWIYFPELTEDTTPPAALERWNRHLEKMAQ